MRGGFSTDCLLLMTKRKASNWFSVLQNMQLMYPKAWPHSLRRGKPILLIHEFWFEMSNS